MLVNIQTIKDIRSYLSEELDEIYQEPEKKAIINLIIKTIFGTSKLHQIYFSEQPADNLKTEEVISLCKELKTGKPVQYALGETSFYDCRIKLNNSVLIPRPETEELVQLIINENRNFNGEIIDFGTGSGCIAIALAVNLPDASVTGIDISPDAIALAHENAIGNSVNITLNLGDILNFRMAESKTAGIIVSNPPYVRNSEKIMMSKNVLGFEPHMALFVDDSDPLIFYRHILETAEKILCPGGKIYFEINEAMGDSMNGLMTRFKYSDVELVKDINGKDRFIKGIKNG